MLRTRCRTVLLGALLLAALPPAVVRAQGTITIEYVAPRDTMVAAFGAAAVSGGYAPNYRGVPITAANVARFRAVAPPLLVRTFDSLQAGTRLRRLVDTLQAVVGHGRVDIRYLLVNDSAGFPTGQNGIFFARRQAAAAAGTTFVWPFATVDSVAGGRYAGLVRLGVHEIPNFVSHEGGWGGWETVIAHESHHTLWVGAPTKWGSMRITYGDGSHTRSELLGDEPVPFDEGIATFYGEMHHAPFGFDSLTAPFFARGNERYELESWSVLAGSLGNMTLPRTVLFDTTMAGGGRYVLWGYKWRDVPANFLLFNENTSTGVFHFFQRNACSNPAAALRLVMQADSSMWQDQTKRYLYYAANQLALAQEALAAQPTSAAATACGTLTSSMLPYALLDIVTHFGMTDQELRAEIARHPVARASRASTEYLTHRAAILHAAFANLVGDISASPIQIQGAVQHAVEYLRQPATLLAARP